MIEKISLIGLGAMGSFFAPRLQKEYGDNFRIIASGQRKDKLSKRGITVNGINYKFNIMTPEEKDTADLIIISTKSYSLTEAIEDIRNQVGKNTLIMPVLNGVDSEEILIKEFGEEHIIHSFMRVSIVMTDGVANFDEMAGKVYFGEQKNNLAKPTQRVSDIISCFSKANIPYSIEADMVKSIWFKYMCNIGENMTCALLGVPFGAFRGDDDANYIRKNAMREVVAIANKKGIDLSEKDIEFQEKTIMVLPMKNKPSTLQDIENGRETEIELFAGNVVKMGKEFGVPTPINEIFYHAIKVYEKKNRHQYDYE